MSLIGRNALFGTAVMAALGVPYALSDKDAEPGSSKSTHKHADGKAGDSAKQSGAASESLGDATAPHNSAMPLEGPAVADLAEVLRFDITPSWLIQRWPRVMNARYAAGPWQAYRVPLVTGTKEKDLAGSLTYSFDQQQKLQRIQFQGSTGDIRPLVAFVTQKFGMARRMTGDPGQFLYEARRDGQTVSELVIRNAPVIDSTLPQNRFQVELALGRPSDHRIFSESSHRFDSHGW